MFSFECSGTLERSLKIRYEHPMESFNTLSAPRREDVSEIEKSNKDIKV